MFTVEQREEFLKIYPSAFESGSQEMKEMKKKQREQPAKIKEEDKITQTDIDIAVEEATIKALSPWLSSVFPAISELKKMEHVEGILYRCTYLEKRYLCQHINSLSIINSIFALLSVNISSQFLLSPLFGRMINKDHLSFFRGDLILFYDDATTVDMPFVLKIDDVSYMCYLFAELWKAGVDVRSFDIFRIDNRFKLIPTLSFNHSSSVLTAKNRYMETRDAGEVRTFYIEELSKYSDTFINSKKMNEIFECMLRS